MYPVGGNLNEKKVTWVLRFGSKFMSAPMNY